MLHIFLSSSLTYNFRLKQFKQRQICNDSPNDQRGKMSEGSLMSYFIVSFMDEPNNMINVSMTAGLLERFAIQQRQLTYSGIHISNVSIEKKLYFNHLI